MVGNHRGPVMTVTAGIGMAGRDGTVSIDQIESFSSGDQAVIDALCCWMRIDHSDWIPGARFAFDPGVAMARLRDASEFLAKIQEMFTDYRGALIKLLAMTRLAGARNAKLCIEVSAPGQVVDIRRGKTNARPSA
jgi:hypothetical protein